MSNKRDFSSLTNSSSSSNGIASDRRPSQHGVNLRWIDRITSYSIPAVSFSYDISFPRYEAMQLTVVPRVLKNADDFSDSIQYFVVHSVKPFYANAVYPGDILLKACGGKCFNIITRFTKDSGPSTVEELVASLAGQPSDQPLQLRLLRLAGKTVNFTPSPAEFSLFLSDKYVAAKYVVTVSHTSPSSDGKLRTQATGSVNTLIVDDGPAMIPEEEDAAVVVSLEAIYLVYMEQQVRSKQCIRWSYCLSFISEAYPTSIHCIYSSAPLQCLSNGPRQAYEVVQHLSAVAQHLCCRVYMFILFSAEL